MLYYGMCTCFYGKGEGRTKRNGAAVSAARRAARMGLLFALAITLSFLESLIPPLAPVPGIKLGLSNIVTMYAVFVLGSRSACIVAALKAVFTLLTRGAVAAALSLCGGLLSVAVMLLLLRLCGRKASYGAVSMAGAVFHNLGQLAAAAALLRMGSVLWYYLPVLVASGIGMGLLTSVLLRAVLPLLPDPDGGGRTSQ